MNGASAGFSRTTRIDATQGKDYGLPRDPARGRPIAVLVRFTAWFEELGIPAGGVAGNMLIKHNPAKPASRGFVRNRGTLMSFCVRVVAGAAADHAITAYRVAHGWGCSRVNAQRATKPDRRSAITPPGSRPPDRTSVAGRTERVATESRVGRALTRHPRKRRTPRGLLARRKPGFRCAGEVRASPV